MRKGMSVVKKIFSYAGVPLLRDLIGIIEVTGTRLFQEQGVQPK